MLLDKNELLSDDQTLVGVSVGTVLSDHSFDQGAGGTLVWGDTAPAQISKGRAPELLCQVTTTCTSAGAATLAVELVMADNEALTSNLTVLHTSATIALATLVAGYRFRIALPDIISKRYIGLRYTVGTAEFTAGTLTAGFADAVDQAVGSVS